MDLTFSNLSDEELKLLRSGLAKIMQNLTRIEEADNGEE